MEERLVKLTGLIEMDKLISLKVTPPAFIGDWKLIMDFFLQNEKNEVVIDG